MRLATVALLLALASDAGAEPMSAELELDCPVTGRSAGYAQAAWNGSIYLAVASAYHPWADTDVVGLRIGPDGTALDSWPFPIATGPGDQGAVVASAGGEFLVAWQRTVDGIGELRANRVTAEGVVLDGAGTLLVSGSIYLVGVAASNTAYLVTWLQGGALMGARIGLDGALAGAPFQIAASAGWASVASDGTGFLVAYQLGWPGDMLARRIAADGTVLDLFPIPLGVSPGTDRFGDVAFGGGVYLVVWQQEDQLMPGTTDIVAARVSMADGLIDATPVVVRAAPGSQESASVARTGATWLVAWHQAFGDGGSQALRLDDALSVVGADPITLGDSSGPDVLSDGTGFMVILNGRDADAVRVAIDGTVIDPPGLYFPMVAETESDPSVAIIGGQSTVAWTQYGVRQQIAGGRLAADGAILDGTGMVLSEVAASQPALAAVGDGGMAVWTSRAQIHARPLAVDGTPAGVDHVVSSGQYGHRSPGLACGTEECLVIWEVGGGWRGQTTDVRAARLEADGTVVDWTGLDFTLGDVAPTWGPLSAVARGPDQYLVVWDSRMSGTLGRRVDPSGGVVDEPPISIPYVGNPAVAFNGDVYLVAGVTYDRVVAVRVSPTGDVLGPSVDLAAIDVYIGGSPPAVAPYADGFLVVWATDCGVLGARVSAGGEVLDPGGFSIAAGAGAPAVATRPDGTAIVTYTRFERSAPYGTSRVFARLVGSDLPDPGGPCNFDFTPATCPASPAPPRPPEVDAGVPALPDAGMPADGSPSGCGCRAPASSAPAIGWLALLVLVTVTARRRPAQPARARRRLARAAASSRSWKWFDK